MKYMSNILPDRPSAYSLVNASIVDGVLNISSNGTVRYSFTKDILSRLTEHFRLSMYTTSPLDSYSPSTFVYITAQTADGYYNYTCTPTGSGIYSAEMTFENAEYLYFAITITSKVPVSFSLWELCPEAADENLTTIIDGVEQSLPKLLDDHNMHPFTISQSESTIALITCNLLDNTDLQGGFLLVYSTPQDCVLTLRFKDNGATELFCPLVYDLKAGRGNIGVPHAYLNRLAGLHNIAVTAQVSVGTLAVPTRGMLFTLDGGYLAQRVIDFGTDIRDISVKQLPGDFSPSEVWAIGIESNEAVVRRRSYDDNTTSSYEPLFIVGEAVEAAIEFDGNWVLRRGNTVYTLETDDVPYVFIVDTLGDLYVQHGGNTASRLLLDTGVSKISACRGYKSHVRPEEDQGLVIAYIKGSTIFYRAYRYDNTTGSYFWDYAKGLQELGDANFVNVHRLNDYRIGIASTTSTGNMWAISNRTYVSQASKPEYYSMGTVSSSAICSMLPTVDTSELTYEARVEDAAHFSIIFSRPVRSAADNIMNDIILSGGASNDDIQDIKVLDNVISITLNKDAAVNVRAVFKPFSLLRKGMVYGWIFVKDVAVQFVLPSFKAETFNTSLSSMVATSTMVPILHKPVNTPADTINMILDLQPTCDFYAITKKGVNANEVVNMILTSEVSCALTHVSVLPT